MAKLFFLVSLCGSILIAAVSTAYPLAHWLWLVWAPIVALGLYDLLQTRHAIRRNFPVLGHFRYLLESIRPEINQYFVESNTDGTPFSREVRSVVYQRSKRQLDTLAFGTRKDVYEIGYEWVNHSLAPTHVSPEDLRITVGGKDCRQPYSLSLFNISAMSYGSLSANAIQALNGGAKLGNFAHNTGEGGITPYHLEPGGDLIWEIGTGYFGCRTPDGKFSPEEFAQKASLPQVKMIEIKLSQGAKPSHGGILPAAKVTAEISKIRGVPMGRDVISPPAHSAFNSPLGLMQFVQTLRRLSGGKPVGFKLCMGKKREFLALALAMIKSGVTPDFITIDGGEGGTGAAPLEFSNSVGMPLREGLILAHNTLVGFNLRSQVKLLTASKVTTGFDIVSRLAMGADACYSARAMMMALGCIQALRCNSNHCPTGVATQNPSLTRGLVVSEKCQRVANYHRETLRSAAELLGAMGLDSARAVRPWHLMKRVGLAEVKHYGELYDFLEPGALLKAQPPAFYARALALATPDSFGYPQQPRETAVTA